MDTLLIQKLIELWEADSPFVCFRLPNENQISLYYQKDNELHHTEDLNCSGFLMAPFDKNTKVPFIPDQYAEKFEYKRPISPAPSTPELDLKPSNKEFFIDLVSKALDAIEKGQLKKVVLSQTQEVKSSRGIVPVFQDILNSYPLAMVYLWHHPLVGTWFGASPEQFINSQKDSTQTVALAGTQAWDELHPPSWSTKEIEEQELVAIQVEEDLSSLFPKDQIKKSGTSNQRAGNLVHLCTHFQFPKLNGNLLEVAKALHPTPAVGGVPKTAAQDFIQTHEAYDRSFYTGFLGPTSSNASQLFVNLRCARWSAQAVTLYIGAGITSGSEPEKEWQETLRKAKTLASVL